MFPAYIKIVGTTRIFIRVFSHSLKGKVIVPELDIEGIKITVLHKNSKHRCLAHFYYLCYWKSMSSAP